MKISMFDNRKISLFSIIIAIVLLTISCDKKSAPHTELVLGTVCTVNAFEDGTVALYKTLFAQLHDIEQKMSVNIPNSEISTINAAAGKNPVAVSDETFFVVERALYFAQRSQGVFDPTVGPLVTLWGIGSDEQHIPTPEAINQALALVNYRFVELDSDKKTVFLQKKGMSLDVGGIAKGYAADVLFLTLKKAGVKSALIDLGGNIYAVGSRADGMSWRIGVKNPHEPEGTPALRVEVKNRTIVTSGMYERFFMQDGVRYHHILDTKNGYPVHNETLSFTVISESSLNADALSTICFILGGRAGVSFASQFSETNAICITDDGTVFSTPETAVTLFDTSLTLDVVKE